MLNLIALHLYPIPMAVRS